MKKAQLLILPMILLFTACMENTARRQQDQLIAKGDVKYGGVFKVNETEYFKSLYPLNITEVVGHRIVNQVYEGLTSLNQSDLTITPCLAESWTLSEDAMTYHFKIRKGVHFADDICFPSGKGREVKAADFVYSFTNLCSASGNNNGFWLFQDLVEGASEYYQSTVNKKPLPGGVSGIRAINDYELEIRLKRPFSGFLMRLSMPFCAVVPKEAIEHYGSGMSEHAVGTGPFRIKTTVPDEAVILERNPNYWGYDSLGNRLPYLDGVKVMFIKEEKVEMMEFKQGNLSMKYRLPLDMTDEIIDPKGKARKDYEQFQLQACVEMSITYYGFLNTDPLYGNLNLRKAFNYSIDRRKICEFTLKGQGVAAEFGMVPPCFKYFDNNKVKGYTYQPQLAKEYFEKAKVELKKAGVYDGKTFPKIRLQINSGGGRNQNVAEAVANQLRETLGVEVEIATVVWAQHTETVESAKAPFYRFGWVADYPDPENFLNYFNSVFVPKDPTEHAYMNSTRYVNPAYDEKLRQALACTDDSLRNFYYEEADNLLMQDAVIMPINFPKSYRLLQADVRNFPQNAMEWRSYREVWFDR